VEKQEDSLQKCLDSTRGYAVKLTDGKGRAKWVGMAFRERNDAFDFKDTIRDYYKKLDYEKNPQKLAQEFETNKESFSLKKGETIKVGFAPAPEKSKNKATGGTSK